MAQTLADIAIKLSADMVAFENDMGRAARLAKKRSNQMKRDLSLAMTAITGAAIAAGGALAGMIKITADVGDKIQKLSQRLGASTEFLSQMRHTTELTGVSFDTFTTGLQRMTRRLAEAASTGKGEAVPALEALGVSIKDIAGLAPEKQFMILADAMEGVSNQGEKVRIAMKLFDTEGVSLIQTMEGGSAAIQMLNDEADALGLTMSQQAADASAEFNDELTRLKSVFTGMAEDIGRDLMPQITDLLQEFRNSDFVKNFAENVKSVLKTIGDLTGEIEFAAKAFGTLFVVNKVNNMLKVFSGFATGAAVSMKGMSVAAATLNTSLNVMKGTMALLGGPIGVIALGTVALNEWVEATNEGRSHTEAFRKATDDLTRSFKTLTAEQRAVEIHQTQMDLGQAQKDLEKIKQINAELGIESNRALRDAQASVDNLEHRLSALFKEYKRILLPAKKTNEEIDETGESADKTGTSIKKLTKDIEDLYKKFKENAFSDFQALWQQFETPLETANRLYAENTASIVAFRIANIGNAEAQEKALQLQKKVNAEYQKTTASIEGALTPYEELIRSIEQEIAMTGMNTAQLRENEAARLLMSFGVIKAGDDLSQYADIIGEVSEKLKQLADAQSIFGDGINSFGDLIRSASQDFSTFFDTLSGGFKNMSGDSQKFADGLGSIVDFGQQVLGMWDATAGQDDAGRVLDTVSQIASTGDLGPVAQAVAQVATFIDSLTGGSLFGTSYQVKSSTRNINIGAGGAGGGTETLETRRRSLFRGTARRRTQGELDADTLNALDTLFDNLQIAIQNSAEAVGGVATDIIEGSFVQEFDKDGNLVSSIATVLGRTYEESFEEFSQRLTAENILAGIGTVFSEVSQIAEQWRGDAETLLDGSQLLLQAGADINAGNGLMATLGEVTEVITGMSGPGESLVETYQRVQGSVMLLDDAFEIIGQSFEGARTDYIQLAADITDAAGGLEQAASLWRSYFDTFYTEQELFEQSLSTATQNRDQLLSSLGLDSNISVEAFREIFEATLPTLSAEATVEWLRAAEAIGIVVDLESELNAERESNAANLASLISDIKSQVEDSGLSPFTSELKNIRTEFQRNIRSARELGASERELAMIQTYAVRQIQQAIRALEQDISGALTDLYGTELDQINQQIEALEAQSSAINSVQQASDNLYASQLAAIQNIRGFVDSLFLDETLSILNPQQQLAEARAQFEELLARAQSGDVDAMNSLPALAQTLLGFGREVFASGQDYTDLFNFVTEALGGLGVTATETDPQQTIIGQNSQMIELLARRNELEEQFDAQARLDAALAIAEQISELVSVTGESFTSLAERLGIPVEEFLSDLGVDLENLTVETAVALGETANLLGVELTDLAESVGHDLGALADDQSLLNNALEQVISQLPEGIANDLDQMLTAIEKSTNPEAREEFLRLMTDYIDDLPENQRDLLAPYFEQIDPITEAQQQVSHMEAIEATNQGIFDQIVRHRSESENDRQNTLDQIVLTNEQLTLLTELMQEFLDQRAVS